MIEKKGIIYKATNIITKEIYIGATTNTLETRKKDHIQKSKTGQGGYFQGAIATYGKESFIWEQIDTANNVDDLAKKEAEYILKYNTLDNGYNCDKGGGGLKKTVYKYNLDGSLNSSYDDLDAAGRSIKSSKKAISKACWNVNNTLGGYLWSYDYVEPFIPNTDCRKKEVSQYDLNGNFLAKFNSVSVASKQTSISKSGIAKCCRGERKQSGGFLWNFV